MTEYLVAWGVRDDSLGPDGVVPDHTLAIVRPLDERENVRTYEAFKVLSALVGHSPLVDLEAARADVENAYATAISLVEGGKGNHHEAIKDLQREYAAWLGAFRSFIDRTLHWLTQKYGAGSDDVKRCKGFFSEEFDANLAYRLAYALRNVSDHQDVVLGDIQLGSRREGADVVHFLAARVDATAIAEKDTKKRIRAETRREMLALPDKIDGGRIVSGALQSCHRILARIIWHMKDELQDAVEIVRGLHFEAVNAGGTAAVFMNEEAAKNPRMEQMRLRVNPNDWAAVAEADLPKCPLIEAAGPVTLTAADLLDA